MIPQKIDPPSQLMNQIINYVLNYSHWRLRKLERGVYSIDVAIGVFESTGTLLLTFESSENNETQIDVIPVSKIHFHT